MTLRLRLKRLARRLLGCYVEPSPAEKRMRVVGRTQVYRAQRSERGRFTLTERVS